MDYYTIYQYGGICILSFIHVLHSGGLHSVAFCCHEAVFTWGCGSDGRLGHPEAVGY